MPNSVAANGTPLSTQANGSRDARYASNIGEPENIVPASNVVRHVSRKRTTFQIGRRSRRRAGAGGRAYAWPFVVANGSAANGRSAMPLSVSRARSAPRRRAIRAWIVRAGVAVGDPWLPGIASGPADHRGPIQAQRCVDFRGIAKPRAVRPAEASLRRSTRATPARGPLATTHRARVARRRGEPHRARLRD